MGDLTELVCGQWLSAAQEQRPDIAGPMDVPFERFETEWIQRPLFERFEHVVALHAQKIAVDDGAVRLTYRELRRASLDLARRIDALTPPRCPIGVLLPNNALFSVAALACLAIGRPFVVIDRNYPAARNDQIVHEAGLRAFIVGRAGSDVGVATSTLCQLDITSSLEATDEANIAIATTEGPAIILYTSGSTGRPKGICNDQRAILQRVAQATNTCHLHSDDRFVLLSSPGTIAGIRETFAALLNGATLHIADPANLGIHGVLHLLQRACITVGYAVPALLRQLLSAPDAKEAFCHARIIRTGGDIPLESDLLLCRSVLPKSCHILIAFSSTEVPTIFQWFVPPEWKADSLRLPIGYAWPGMSFRLVDEDDAFVPDGNAGELVVKSRYLALGLWQDGRLQPGTFLSDPMDPEARILHTGDLIRLRPDGLCEMIGRKDRQIKIRGLRVDPGEAEAVLRGLNDVADAAVIGRRQGEAIDALVAFVVARKPPGSTLAEELMRVLSIHLPPHSRPTRIHFIDTIPQLPGFKTDVQALEQFDRCATREEVGSFDAETALDRRSSVSSDSASIAVRDAVERAWTRSIDRGSFLKNLRWDEAGGDSLKALHFWLCIEEALNQRLPLDAFDQEATPSEIILALEKIIASPPVNPANARNRPTVHYFPGTEGDVPMLAHFRAAFEGTIHFEIIDYLPWHQMIAAGATFNAIVDSAISQIPTTKENPISLLGHSYGGFVVQETARRLLEEGHRVGFIGMIDARRQTLVQQYNGSDPNRKDNMAGRVLGLTRRLLSRPKVTMRQLFLSRAPLVMLRAAGRSAMLFPEKSAFSFHAHLIFELRLRALRKMAERPLRAPVTLFRSAECLNETPDFGWKEFCPQLNICNIGGDHTTILLTPKLEVLRDRIVEEVNKSLLAVNGGPE